MALGNKDSLGLDSLLIYLYQRGGVRINTVRIEMSNTTEIGAVSVNYRNKKHFWLVQQIRMKGNSYFYI